VPRRLWIAALSFWPGLPQIWSGQEVLGLILAAVFATAVNLAVIARFIWTEAFAPGWSSFLAMVAVCTWLTGLGYTLWWVWQCHPHAHTSEIDTLFREAMESYLKGRFQEARQQLERIVDMDDGDADALMQLGTLFVRTEQPALARRAFRQCLERDGGSKWRWEIQQELARLELDSGLRS
jgi:cytochrome c-type biogenesis protein CcmH/NrfG